MIDNNTSKNSINDLITNLVSEPKTPQKTKNKGKLGAQAVQAELEFSLVVLLVELASSDQSFDLDEYNTIYLGLQRVFNTRRGKVREYVNRAILELAQFRGTKGHALNLKEHLSKEKITEVIEVIEDLIASDGTVDPSEIYHRQKIKKILLS